MTYRKEDIPEMIKALKKVRDRIYPGSVICHTLSVLAQHGHISYGVACTLSEMISLSLGSHLWLDSWVRAKQGNWPGSDVMMRLRRKWIAKMIADLQEYAKS